MFRSCEHNATRHHLPLDKIDQQLALVTFLDERNVLLNPVGGGRFWTDVDLNRTVKHSSGQGSNGFGHGSTEHEILTLFWDEGKNTLNVLAETHVKHAVSLIQNEVFHTAQINVSLIV